MLIINRFEEAVRQREMKVSVLNINDWNDIELEYKESKKALVEYIRKLKKQRKHLMENYWS